MVFAGATIYGQRTPIPTPFQGPPGAVPAPPSGNLRTQECVNLRPHAKACVHLRDLPIDTVVVRLVLPRVARHSPPSPDTVF